MKVFDKMWLCIHITCALVYMTKLVSLKMINNYTAKFDIICENLHHTITFHFNDFSLANEKSPY